MQKILYGLVAVAVLAGALWWYGNRAPEAVPYVLELAPGDTVTSWSFQGAYTGNTELVAKAEAEIARLMKLLGTRDEEGESPDYELYVSIANQYGLMGDGENELRYLGYALSIDDDVTGLAWFNAAVLYERLGAFNTARMAYEKAATAQPVPQYVNAYDAFAKAHPAPR